jgi:HAMP domain-containing protein
VSQENSAPEARPRRNLASLVIEPFKQIKFGVYVIGISVAFVAVSAGMFVWAFYEQYKHVMTIFNVVDPQMQYELVNNNIFQVNAMRIGVVFVAYIGITFWVVFKLTHRYYGPLVSIERFVTQMTNGQYDKRCKIRTKDELHALVAKLNEMATKLEERHGASLGERDTNERKSDDLRAAS